MTYTSTGAEPWTHSGIKKVSEIQARLGHESLATTGRYPAALRADENPHADALAVLFGLDAE